MRYGGYYDRDGSRNGLCIDCVVYALWCNVCVYAGVCATVQGGLIIWSPYRR